MRRQARAAKYLTDSSSSLEHLVEQVLKAHPKGMTSEQLFRKVFKLVPRRNIEWAQTDVVLTAMVKSGAVIVGNRRFYWKALIPGLPRP